MSPAPIRDEGFHLFVYGTLRSDGSAADRLAGCTLVAKGTVRGTLYDIDREYPALMLYGHTPVTGEIWHVPSSAMLAELDAYEGIEDGLFRRVAASVEGYACWMYVAGHGLAERIAAAAGDS